MSARLGCREQRPSARGFDGEAKRRVHDAEARRAAGRRCRRAPGALRRGACRSQRTAAPPNVSSIGRSV